MKHARFMLLWALWAMSLHAHPEEPWKINRNEDGVAVYTRTVEGSDFKSFKATVLVHAALDELVKTLKDVAGYPQWFGHTQAAKLLAREGDVQYVYIETMFPWPFRNRDMVYKMEMAKVGPGMVRVTLNGLAGYAPEKANLVRMKKANGFILLAARGDRTEVVYEFHSEPGGDVSPWMANDAIADLPFKTLSGLRALLNERGPAGQPARTH